MRSAGRVVSRDQLAAVLYQRQATPFERSVDVHVSHLRKKLERNDRELIRTVRGVGYLFCPAMSRVRSIFTKILLVVVRHAGAFAGGFHRRSRF